MPNPAGPTPPRPDLSHRKASWPTAGTGSLPARRLSILTTIASIGAAVAVVCHMMPRFGGGG
eukprot:10738304-Alexandrium_andersonii.AAC.1